MCDFSSSDFGPGLEEEEIVERYLGPSSTLWVRSIEEQLKLSGALGLEQEHDESDLTE